MSNENCNPNRNGRRQQTDFVCMYVYILYLTINFGDSLKILLVLLLPHLELSMRIEMEKVPNYYHSLVMNKVVRNWILWNFCLVDYDDFQIDQVM
jgi:hypothetical protein